MTCTQQGRILIKHTRQGAAHIHANICTGMQSLHNGTEGAPAKNPCWPEAANSKQQPSQKKTVHTTGLRPPTQTDSQGTLQTFKQSQNTCAGSGQMLLGACRSDAARGGRGGCSRG